MSGACPAFGGTSAAVRRAPDAARRSDYRPLTGFTREAPQWLQHRCFARVASWLTTTLPPRCSETCRKLGATPTFGRISCGCVPSRGCRWVHTHMAWMPAFAGMTAWPHRNQFLPPPHTARRYGISQHDTREDIPNSNQYKFDLCASVPLWLTRLSAEHIEQRQRLALAALAAAKAAPRPVDSSTSSSIQGNSHSPPQRPRGGRCRSNTNAPHSAMTRLARTMGRSARLFRAG